MNNIISTCTLIQKPQQNTNKWVAYAIANREYKDRNDVKVVTGQLFYLICHNLDVLPLIGKGSRLGIKGNFVGEWQTDEKYPDSFSCGGPKIWIKDDQPTTAFMIECNEVVVLNGGERVSKLDQTDLTHVSLLGKITAKGCEMRYTKEGRAISTASIAVKNTKPETVDGKKIKTNYTVFFRLHVWGDRAETVSKYWIPKAAISVEGDLEVFRPKEGEQPTGAPTIWYTRDTEEPRASYELRVGTWSFPPTSNGGSHDYTPERDTDYGTPDEDDVIPF